MAGAGHVAGELGAWAVDAVPAAEAASIAAHLRECPVCAAEAGRLKGVASLLGVVESVPPTPSLGDAVLAAALTARPPVAVPLLAPARAYAVQAAEMDSLLDTLTGAQWSRPAAKYGSVRTLVEHLAENDAPVATALGAPTVPAPGRAGWRAGATTLLRALASADQTVLERPARLAGPVPATAPMRDALVQRAFETWTHADDIRVALHLPVRVPPPEQIRSVVGLGVRLLPTVLYAAGTHRPGRAARLALSGPGNGEWLVTPALEPLGGTAVVAATIRAEAVDVCRLMAGRIDPARLPRSVDGDRGLAEDLLAAAATLGCD
ncbi:hypothetical protein FPZ12_019745 [Amycolatopsis acidicola]|uniref:Maleylpyruvate isomerase family mycothiol-dependent enzyme n=1 Tax=Amycolatopsis acidicola TaxID=2596893 RepID=A0A5N0UZV8_9PSEU|nr:maleylpyruvate isomerase N-terminal domain-containing protein [Amycolatopsis acidicola]KAA9159605.1 hypothetical protein FPZ12_019745 [Amycolatopsis acidicola]